MPRYRNGMEVTSMIAMLYVEKNMLKFMHDVTTVIGMRLIKVRERGKEAGRVKRKKLRKQQYTEEYSVILWSMIVDWNEVNKVGQM